MYQRMTSQSTRLGAWEGLGQDASGIITAIGSSISNVINSISQPGIIKTTVRGQVDITKAQFDAVVRQTEEQTKQILGTAQYGVEQTKATYLSLAKLVLGSGAAIAALILATGFAYSLTKKSR